VLESEWDFPPEVAVRDLGTPGLDLAPWLSDVDLVVIVDTVAASARRGEVRTYARAELLAHAPGPRLSPHDPGLKDAVLTAELAGTHPRELWVVGVVPERVAMGTGLSAAVRGAGPQAAAEVLRLLRERGFSVPRRAARLPPDIWWEAPPATTPRD
jgi:hydrogenase maturation protease